MYANTSVRDELLLVWDCEGGLLPAKRPNPITDEPELSDTVRAALALISNTASYITPFTVRILRCNRTDV
jgi:hypothetical protein